MAKKCTLYCGKAHDTVNKKFSIKRVFIRRKNVRCKVRDKNQNENLQKIYKSTYGHSLKICPLKMRGKIILQH